MQRAASYYTYGGLSGSAHLFANLLISRVKKKWCGIRCSSAERKAIEHERQVNSCCWLVGSMIELIASKLQVGDYPIRWTHNLGRYLCK